MGGWRSIVFTCPRAEGWFGRRAEGGPATLASCVQLHEFFLSPWNSGRCDQQCVLTDRMAASTTESFSFSPWSRENSDEGALKDVLARVNFERGHFRAITEASLQEEIAAEGALELSESEDDSSTHDDEDETESGDGKPTTRVELYKAKNDMLTHIRAAEAELAYTVDFMSLLMSKDDPVRAQTTMSPTFRGSGVPMGTLGADIWQRMPLDKAQEAQDETLATHVRLTSLQRSADSLLSAANALNDNVRRETEYWNQILSISEQGWNVSRIRGTQRKLGVHFGFSESSTEFSRKGMAALHVNPDGTVVLDRGIGSKPKSLRAVLRQDGEVVGASKLPIVPDAEETTLEARIRYARDSLFDEELYHEMIRESRTLASLGVGMKDSAITFTTRNPDATGVQVSFELVSLDEDHTLYSAGSEQGDLAQAIVLAVRLLLSKAHRDRLNKRSEIPPPLSAEKKDDRPLLPILRPVIAFIMHRAVLEQLNSYLNTVSNVLGLAKIGATNRPTHIAMNINPEDTGVQALTALLMQPWTSTASLTITSPDSESFTFEFKVDTTLAYRSGPAFTLSSSDTTEHRLDSIEELSSAADDTIMSGLTVALKRILGDGWRCHKHEALLSSTVGGTDDEEKRRTIVVRFGSEQKALALSSGSEKRIWRLNGTSADKGFWDAAVEIARPE